MFLIVTYTTKDGAAHEFDTLEFLAELSAHIPKTYESLTRYYGRYSPSPLVQGNSSLGTPRGLLEKVGGAVAGFFCDHLK